MERQPKIGYKAVICPPKRWCILAVEIPDHAIVVDCGDGHYRADRVIPRKLSPVHTKTAIWQDTMTYSYYDPNFYYLINTMATAYLAHECYGAYASGIHFFDTFGAAVKWGEKFCYNHIPF